MERYLALFEPGLKAGGYTVTFPDFGYGVTQGETVAEAMEMAQDLLMLTIGDYIRESKQLPLPVRRRGAEFRPVPLPALQSAKVDLYTAFLESGLKKAEFAVLEYPGRALNDCSLFGITLAWIRSKRRSPRSANVCTLKPATRRESR